MGFQLVKCNMMQLTKKNPDLNKPGFVHPTGYSFVLNVENFKLLIRLTITNDFKWNMHIRNI